MWLTRTNTSTLSDFPNSSLLVFVEPQIHQVILILRNMLSGELGKVETDEEGNVVLTTPEGWR